MSIYLLINCLTTNYYYCEWKHGEQQTYIKKLLKNLYKLSKKKKTNKLKTKEISYNFSSKSTI